MNFRVFITLNLIAMASILLFLPAATGKKFSRVGCTEIYKAASSELLQYGHSPGSICAPAVRPEIIKIVRC